MPRILHVIPGLNDDVSSRLLREHFFACLTVSKAAQKFDLDDWDVEVRLVRAPGWQNRAVGGIVDWVNDELSDRTKWIGNRFPPVAPFLDQHDYNGFDLVIFSNSDICLVSDAYRDIVQRQSSAGGSISLTRRTVVDEIDFREVNRAYLVRRSKPHPGYDFFVAPADSFDTAVSLLGKYVCLGLPPIGKMMCAAFDAASLKFTVINDSFITFHPGDEREWSGPTFDRFRRLNLLRSLRLLPRFLSLAGNSGLRAALAWFGGVSGVVRKVFLLAFPLSPSRPPSRKP